MSMFWNPVTGTYQRCCPALSPVKRQPLVLKSQPQDGIQVAKRQPLKQPLVQPRSVARDQPRKQPQDVAKNVDQPLNSGMKRQPPMLKRQPQWQQQFQSQPPKYGNHKEQPPAAKRQPQMLKRQPRNAECQPDKCQPLFADKDQPPVAERKQPPKGGVLIQPETEQPLKSGILSQNGQPRSRPRGHPPDILCQSQPPADNQPNIQPLIGYQSQPPAVIRHQDQSQPQIVAHRQSPSGRQRQPPDVAQPPIVQPPGPDPDPEPDPNQPERKQLPVVEPAAISLKSCLKAKSKYARLKESQENENSYW